MIWCSCLLITAFKLLLMPAYYSTDLEVHRNWLAVTHSLDWSSWYYEKTSEWTLDYPPLFGWFQYLLSLLARYFDPAMLVLTNLNYASPPTIVFQRLSVILADLVYITGIKRCLGPYLDKNVKHLLFVILFGNVGLLMVDHIHFQYNGFLFGILLLSIGEALRHNHLRSALWFAILLNLKHIFLYMAPAYFVFLLRCYCFTGSSKNYLYSFSLKNLVKLAAVVVAVFLVSFGPFYKHIPQILERLFPFKRGLSHAYWAPNFWALYNFLDKVLVAVLPRFGFKVSTQISSMTGGLVQEYDHTVLTSVTPLNTFLITFLTMLPALFKLWRLASDKKRRPFHFIRCLVVCAGCSFIFGWHVHEKAILLIIIPLCLLAVVDPHECQVFLVLSLTGHYSLFPLLWPPSLLGVKVCLLVLYSYGAFTRLTNLYACKRPAPGSLPRLPMLNHLETLYAFGLVPLFALDSVVSRAVPALKAYPFLPLMLTSVYCSVGVLYSWLKFYRNYLNMCVSDADAKKLKQSTN